MGEEYGETTPFQFFADFQDPALKKAVSEGRRGEFKDFDFNEVPDPEDPATFERSKLTWADAPENRETLNWYRQLLSLRRQYVIHNERRADAEYAEGVLTMQVPARVANILIQAGLQPGASLPKVNYGGWREALRSDNDGYAVRVFVQGD
jgi:maltooligosyltrehalose trehalohydrolase